MSVDHDFYTSRFDDSADAVLVVDEQGVIEYVSEAGAQLFDSTAAELSGRPVEDLIPPRLRDAHARHRAVFANQPSTGRSRPSRIVQALRRGQEFAIAVDLAPLHTPGGPRTLATLREIADWIDSVAWTTSAFDNAPVAMALTSVHRDGDRVIRTANTAMAKLFGYAPHGLTGLSLRELTHPDDDEPDAEAARQMAAGDMTIHVHQERIIHRDGHHIWIELHSRLLPATDDDSLALAHLVDISARVQLEAEQARSAVELEEQVVTRTAELAESERRLRQSLDQLHEREERLRLVLDATTTGVWDWNIPDGHIAFSENWLAALGYSPHDLDLDDWDWAKLIHPDDWPEAQRRLSAHLDGGSDHCECVYRLRHKDSSWRWFRSRGQVVERSADGRPQRMIGAEIDISDQRRLEQQLVHSAKMQALGSFAGGIAHDFNNVMAIVRGHVELLRGNTQDPADIDRRLTIIEGAVERASSLVRRLMQLGRPNSDNPVDVDLVQFVSGVVPTLAQLIGEDISLELDLVDEPLTVHIDVGRLEALVLNIAANARDAMSDGGVLAFTLRRLSETSNHNESAQLVVTDTGVGMDAETLSSIFEPFFTTKAPGLGAGLGLATAYSTVTEAGGSITADSHPDIGTTITIELPIVATPPDLPAPNDRVEPGTRSATILVVEDEAELLELTADVLRSGGHRVHEALSAEEALRILDEHADIELVLTDALMPDMSGAELGRLVARRWPAVKVLYLSGYAATSPTASDIDPRHLLAKPIGQHELITAVADMLDAER